MVAKVITLESTNTGEGKHKSFVSLGKGTQKTLELVVNYNLLSEPEILETLHFGFIAEHTSSSDFEIKV